MSYGRVTATCRGQISRSRERNGSRAARTCQEWKRSGTGSRMDHPLTVGGISASFRYLGVLLTPSLSWSNHIAAICSKARKLLGLIFRHFYSHSSPSTLIKLYISLIRPHLEYCSLIWDPSSPTLIRSLESVQLFALKLASKFRPFLIPSLKSQFNLPSLAS